MKASWPYFIIMLPYCFHASMLPKKLCRLVHMICHHVAGVRTLSLRTSIALALSFSFPRNSNGGNHSEGSTWLEPGQSERPPPLHCPGRRDGSPTKIRPAAPFWESTEAQEKWETAEEFFLWELLGELLLPQGDSLPKNKAQEEESKTGSLGKTSDDIILTSVSWYTLADFLIHFALEPKHIAWLRKVS